MTGEVLSGSAPGGVQANRRHDTDASRNVFLHLTRDIGSSLRLGTFGCYGRSTVSGAINNTRMPGVDGSVTLGPVELNGQYVHRRDDEPTCTAGEAEVWMHGSFGELIIRPSNGRLCGFAPYSLATANLPLLDVRLGGPGPGKRCESISGRIGISCSGTCASAAK